MLVDQSEGSERIQKGAKTVDRYEQEILSSIGACLACDRNIVLLAVYSTDQNTYLVPICLPLLLFVSIDNR